jgi:hypothetical protein
MDSGVLSLRSEQQRRLQSTKAALMNDEQLIDARIFVVGKNSNGICVSFALRMENEFVTEIVQNG